MKQILLIVFLITGMVVNAQRNALPENVKSTFEEKYPVAENVKIKTKKDLYNIRFELNEKAVLAVFDKSGAWIKTETKLEKNKLPIAVISAIDKKYSKGTYSDAVYCEQSEGGNFYQVQVDMPGAVFYLEVDQSGKILKTEKVEMQNEIPSQSGEE